MEKIEKIHKDLKIEIKDSNKYFRENAEFNAKNNWKTIKPMSIFYLLFLICFTEIICPWLDIDLSSAVIIPLIFLHSVLSLWIILSGSKVKPAKIVNLAICVFGFEILFAAAYFEFSAFPGFPSFIFPSCLVLMTQVYTRHPGWRFFETLTASLTYLVFSWYLKGSELFFLDFVAIFIAVMIACLAVFTMTMYMVQNYDTNLALEKMCDMDQMTGVNNKQTFQFRVESYMKDPSPKGYAMAICDIDKFKSVNDTYGHRSGDRLLKIFSEKLHHLETLNDKVIIGRFGGDEFVMFFKEYDDENMIRRQLKSLCIIQTSNYFVTASIGIAFSPTPSTSFEQLFDSADHYLYQAKATSVGTITMGNVKETEVYQYK